MYSTETGPMTLVTPSACDQICLSKLSDPSAQFSDTTGKDWEYTRLNPQANLVLLPREEGKFELVAYVSNCYFRNNSLEPEQILKIRPIKILHRLLPIPSIMDTKHMPQVTYLSPILPRKDTGRFSEGQTSNSCSLLVKRSVLKKQGAVMVLMSMYLYRLTPYR